MKVSSRRLVVWTAAGTGVRGVKGDGGPAVEAQVTSPTALAVQYSKTQELALYFTESVRHVVRRLDLLSNLLTTVAGTGSPGTGGEGEPGRMSALANPQGLTVDNERGLLYIAEFANRRIRALTIATGLIDTAVGGGGIPLEKCDHAMGLALASPLGVTVGPEGDLYFSDQWAHRVIRIVRSSGAPEVVAGSGRRGYAGDGGPALAADMDCPSGVAVSDHGDLYVSDESNRRIRRVDARTGVIQSIVTDIRATFLTTVHGGLLINDLDASCIFDWRESTGDLSLVSGTGSPGYSGDGGPAQFAELDGPNAVVAGRLSGSFYIADQNNHRVRCVADRDLIT